MINKLKYKSEQKLKDAFYCSDYDKMEIELYFSFVGEPYTNPPQWYETLKWGAGKGVEEAMLGILKENGITRADYIQEEHGRVDMEREGIVVHGYMDAMTNGERAKEFDLEPDCPIEIKSINNKNSVDIAKYEKGYPRESYVGQLASYMEFTGKETGYLFVASIDGLKTFMFECKKVGDGEYLCGSTRVNIKNEYKRWSQVYNDYIKEGKRPEISCRYKIPVEEVDWSTVSKGDISKARNNAKVIGDEGSWKIQYSNWKDKILEIQGATLGYDQRELDIIREKTKGYTTW